MSVPYKIEASEELLTSIGGSGTARASDRIPFIARPFVSDRAKKCLDLVGLLLPAPKQRRLTVLS